MIVITKNTQQIQEMEWIFSERNKILHRILVEVQVEQVQLLQC